MTHTRWHYLYVLVEVLNFYWLTVTRLNYDSLKTNTKFYCHDVKFRFNCYCQESMMLPNAINCSRTSTLHDDRNNIVYTVLICLHYLHIALLLRCMTSTCEVFFGVGCTTAQRSLFIVIEAGANTRVMT